MRVPALVLLCSLCVVLPAPAAAWGFEAHKLIAEQMIVLLPAELRPLFEKRKTFVVERSVDPDLWRPFFPEEAPHHFLDLDYFGAPPFRDLPREYDRAVQRWGREVIHAQGLLPWRAAEVFGRLRREFEALGSKSPSPYVLDNIVYFATVMGHYVGDAHVPLHAVLNHDGQLTNQRGVHSRWESELFERVRPTLRLAPRPPVPITDPRTFMFDTLLESNRLAAEVLAADRQASSGREFYDDGYFEAFGKLQRDVLERRLNDAIAAFAGLVIGAWDAAGRPPVPVELPAAPRRVPQRRR